MNTSNSIKCNKIGIQMFFKKGPDFKGFMVKKNEKWAHFISKFILS